MSKPETKNMRLGRERLYTLINSPVLTEKSNAGSAQNKFTLNVQLDANKMEIKQAVEEIFKVQVKAVNTLRVKGKIKRFKGMLGQRKERKKAIITLVEGSSID